ncbi:MULTISPECIES: hypothetical protein [unclassified Psychrobacillus]|uniref:hypothetical protein n=1 Tax=unclassified Psychrobacillus TaxID=2636677 RepID=UPI00146AC298|nr:hypothetical protein [Psychrobacillus sp. BL-248-WT-3]NME06698.1 hypothetical protein [Psychrobacillus sp. BL-248-WT-3]
MKQLLSNKMSMLLLTTLGALLLLGACSDEPKEEEAKEEKKEMLAYVRDFDLPNKSLIIDEVEWIEESDTDRIKELGLDTEKDLATGFMIYDESQKAESLKLAEDAEFYLVNQDDTAKPKQVEEKEFVSYLAVVKGPYDITLEDGVVVKVSEKYTP